MRKAKTDRGYGLIILLVVVAIIAILAVKIIGKPAQSTSQSEEAVQKAEADKAATYQGAIQTKTKANSVVGGENLYNQNLQNELDQ
jgi:Tfp pilus assembly protein PilE